MGMGDWVQVYEGLPKDRRVFNGIPLEGPPILPQSFPPFFPHLLPLLPLPPSNAGAQTPGLIHFRKVLLS